MKPCRKLTGKLLHFPDPVIQQIRLFVRLQAMMPGEDENRLWTGLPWFEVAIGKDGSYQLPRLSDGHGYLQRALYFADPLTKSWPKLQAAGRPLGRSERILPLPAVKIAAGTQDVRLPPIHNRDWRLLDLRVQQSDGRRGRDLPIRILYPDNETSTRNLSRPLGKIDGKGRFRRLFFGPLPAIYIQGPRGYALLEESQLHSERKGTSYEPRKVRLTPMPTIRGSVAKIDGNPAAGVRVRLRAYRILPAHLRGGPGLRYFKALSSFALNTEVQTDGEGRFEIPYLPFPERKLLLSATWRDEDGDFHHAQRGLEFDHDKPVDLVFSR